MVLNSHACLLALPAAACELSQFPALAFSSSLCFLLGLEKFLAKPKLYHKPCMGTASHQCEL